MSDEKGNITNTQVLYRRVFTTEEGQAVLRSLFHICMVNEPSGFDANSALFHEGARSVFFNILELVYGENEEDDPGINFYKDNYMDEGVTE